MKVGVISTPEIEVESMLIQQGIEDCLTAVIFRTTLDTTTPVQPATPVGGTVQIKQLIVVPDRVLCTRYFIL